MRGLHLAYFQMLKRRFLIAVLVSLTKINIAAIIIFSVPKLRRFVRCIIKTKWPEHVDLFYSLLKAMKFLDSERVLGLSFWV